MEFAKNNFTWGGESLRTVIQRCKQRAEESYTYSQVRRDAYKKIKEAKLND